MSQKRPLSGLAIAAIVFAFLFPPLGLLLGIIGAVKLSDTSEKRGKGLARMGAIVGGLFVLLSVIGAAVMIPALNRFQCKAKQAEARSQLKSLMVNQMSYQAEHERFASLEELEWQKFDGSTSCYEFTLLSHGKDNFKAQARASAEGLGNDTWTIDKSGTLVNVVKGCD